MIRKINSQVRRHKSAFFPTVAVAMIIFIASSLVSAEVITFEDNWGEAGFNLVSQGDFGVEVVFSITEMYMEDLMIDNQIMKTIQIPGVFLPNDAGAPNLPGNGRYIAIPRGATASVQIIDSRTEVYYDIDIAPAAPIPKVTDTNPPVYIKNPQIYSLDANYPKSPVIVSQRKQIRGIDVVILGITPFQYNPVDKELVVYKDIRVKIDFTGGGNFNEYGRRSRYWEPTLRGHLLNYATLPEADFSRAYNTDELALDYLIIIPDDPVFMAWADTIKDWRNQQGIVTDWVTITEVGVNNFNSIYYYIIGEYYSVWPPALSAVLILSDFQYSGDVYGITSGYWDNYCVSDNKLVDFDIDEIQDVAIARICAQNETHLSRMIGKMLDYERTPPTDPGFYDHPLITGGWQSDRWFLLCAETIWGYFTNVHGKSPERQYDICPGSSSPGTSWSSAQNTYTVVSYFGPNGLGYIPFNPEYLNSYMTGSSWGINAAINNGAFLVQHRDHGLESGWGTPSYSIGNVNQLTNDMPTFVFSTNCLTGKYDHTSNVFVEVFHRHEHGALGANAPSEVSFSFTNDTFVWGMYDYMWPDFDPGYGSDITGSATLQPCFANASGKNYLQASSWPYNISNKIHTYHLFHHHGDAFLTLYSEIPQTLIVSHQSVITSGDTVFNVTADSGAVVALTVNNEIIGVAEATGMPMDIPIEPVQYGDTLLITATLQNHYRYMDWMEIFPLAAQFVIFNSLEINDATGNNNGLLDMGEDVLLSITVENIGTEVAENVNVNISTEDIYTTIHDGEEFYSAVPAGGTATIADGFEIEVSLEIPDMHVVNFTLTAENLAGTWESPFNIIAHSPAVEMTELVIDDPAGNNNQNLDPGETADFQITLANIGSGDASNLVIELSTQEPLITIPNGIVNLDFLLAGEEATTGFLNISADPAMQNGTMVDFAIDIISEEGYSAQLEFTIEIGSSMYLPSGPDGYGYYAYDMYDGSGAPQYEWTEIAPAAGGSGTVLTIGDNQTVQVDLPFDFQFYGNVFDEISVCEDGWLAFGVVTSGMPMNFGIPNSMPPNDLVSLFWFSLFQTAQTQFCYLHDTENHRFIVEWYQVRLGTVTGPTLIYQAILYDPEYYTTNTGDGEIQFNYHTLPSEFSNCTVGIENFAGDIGLQYLYNTNYIEFASPLEDGFAVKFTTEFEESPIPPLPFSLISPFNADTCWTSSTELVWHSTTDPNQGEIPLYNVWLDTLPDLSTKRLMGENLSDTTLVLDNLSDDHANYWTVCATDPVLSGTWATDTLYFTTYFPEVPGSFALLLPENGAILEEGETVFNWDESVDPDPGDQVIYTLWFLVGEDSLGFDTQADSMAVNPDTISVLIPGETAFWYVSAHSSMPDTMIVCEERFSFTAPVFVAHSSDMGIPEEFCLFQNFPNPFNPVTSIKFGIPEAAMTKIAVYDVLGRQTTLLAHKNFQPGYYTVQWEAGESASGIYFVRLESQEFVKTIKMLLVR